MKRSITAIITAGIILTCSQYAWGSSLIEYNNTEALTSLTEITIQEADGIITTQTSVINEPVLNETAQTTVTNEQTMPKATEIIAVQTVTNTLTVTQNPNRPVLTSTMTRKQKQDAIKKYMQNYGYSEYNIKYIIWNIYWEKITNDVAPSFYTALEKGYLMKYINEDNVKKYVTDERIMSKINKLIELMLKHGYQEDSIYTTVKYANWSNITNDFAPSFYTVVKKGYIENYCNPYCLGKYFTDEKVMSRVVKLINMMKENKYTDNVINSTLSNIEWKNIDNLTPSFYIGLQKRYIGNTISAKKFSITATDESKISLIIKLVELMKKQGYEDSDILTVTENIYWDNVTDDFAPEFYTLVQKRYLLKKVRIYDVCPHVTNNEAMSKIVNIIDLMNEQGYTDSVISSTIASLIYQEKGIKDIAPSFNIAIKNGYIGQEINIESHNKIIKYYDNENIMSQIIKVIKLMKEQGYYSNNISSTIQNIKWDEVNNDLPDSFYVALKSGYIGNYIKPSCIGEYFTDENSMNKIIKTINIFKAKYYSSNEIRNIINYIHYEYVTDIYMENLKKYNSFRNISAKKYAKDSNYKNAIDELMQMSKDEEYKVKSIELYNSFDAQITHIVNNNINLTFDEKKELISNISLIINNNSQYNIDKQQKLIQIINNPSYSDEKKTKLLQSSINNIKKAEKIQNTKDDITETIIKVITAPIWVPFVIWFGSSLNP